MSLVIGGAIIGGALGVGTTVGVLGGAALGAAAGGILGGSGGPDTSGMSDAAGINAQISREQLAFAQQQYKDSQARQAAFDPKFAALIDQSIASSKTADDRSAQQWQQYVDTYMPIEKELADRSLNYDTPGRRATAVSQARAGVAANFDQARQEFDRSIARRGGSVSGGNQQALDYGGRLAEAKASAAAADTATRATEATGLSLLDNSAKFGRGMTSTGLQAAGLALQANGAAQSGLTGQQATYNASLAPAAQLYGGASNSASAAGQTYGQIAGMQQKSQSDQNAGLSGLGQLAGMYFTGGMYPSDEEMKEVGKGVDGDRAREALENPKAKPKHWKYKRGMGDGGKHIGRMAGTIPGDPMDGKAIDVISELGLHHAAIADLSREVRGLRNAKRKGAA